MEKMVLTLIILTAASAIYRNNTLYFNGVHNIIQMQEHGELLHVGNNKVAGIKANGVLNATIVNNIIVTRDDEYSALALNDITGTRVAVNNIFQNGTYAWPATQENNLINVDPLFVSAPTTVNGSIDITTTDFSLTSDSPAINAGNSNHTPLTDIFREPTTIYYPMQYHHQVLKILLTNGQVLVQL